MKPKQNSASAIEAWEAALEEGDMDDKKARINKKVIPDLYKNLLLACALSEEFTKAEDHLQCYTSTRLSAEVMKMT